MRLLVSTLVALGLVLAVDCHVGRQEFMPPNRCLPGQSCFPSRLELREFAATLQGKLYFPHSPEYAGLVRNVNNRRRRHPAMVVLAEVVSDVQKAMLFARKFQLMVTSCSDLRDPTGRDNYDGSLNINLSLMNAVGSINKNTTRSEYGEVTAQTGATWEAVYQEARNNLRDVVAPNAIKSTVGSTVGNEGIGPLVRIYGLVGDNLLEAQLVMADGSIVTVAEHQVKQDFGDGLVKKSFDRSLLAAIAAGGVGPWGIPISYTFQMKQAPAGVVRVRQQYNLWQGDAYVGADTMETVMSGLGALPDKWGGYIYLSGMASPTEPNTRGQLVLNLIFYGQRNNQDPDYLAIESLFGINLANLPATGPNKLVEEQSILVSEQNQNDMLGVTEDIRFYSFNTYLQTMKPAVPNEAVKLTEALLFALNSPTVDSNYFCTGQIMGGAAQDGPKLPHYDFTNPIVRRSYMSLTCHLVFPGRGLDDSFYVDHVMDFVQLLQPFGTGKSIYWAQADVPDWKTQFHGEMYGKLISTKLQYDVDNFLWCPNCVGSDFRINKGCNQQKMDKDGLLKYGNMLGGYISGNRYHSTKQREANRAHKARLLYIHQMVMKGN